MVRPAACFVLAWYSFRMQITHAPGRHCASTAVSDITRFHGAPLSEAMCFGLGEGLGLYYVGLPGLEPSRIFHGRALHFEQQFFQRIGTPFHWDQHADPAAAEAALRAALDAGVPALIQTDIYYLPYYNSKTHFAGHLIAVWGYDRERDVYFVTDTERPGALEVPAEAMRRARYCKVPPFPMEGNLFAPRALALPADLPDRMVEAVRENARKLLAGENFYEGLAALNNWRNDWAAWNEFADWKWTARLIYQTIMKRGTGGGAFRLMYADFLAEAAEHAPALRAAGLAAPMRAVGEAWDALALALRDVSEGDALDTTAARAALERLYDLEAKYLESAARI